MNYTMRSEESKIQDNFANTAGKDYKSLQLFFALCQRGLQCIASIMQELFTVQNHISRIAD